MGSYEDYEPSQTFHTRSMDSPYGSYVMITDEERGVTVSLWDDREVLVELVDENFQYTDDPFIFMIDDKKFWVTLMYLAAKNLSKIDEEEQS